MRTVLLTNGYEPLGIISWFKAFSLLWEGKVDPIWNYPDKKLHSFKEEFDWPAIVLLKKSVKTRPFKEIHPSTRSILIRDMYVCQYCGARLTNNSGTKDHVIPIAKGGKSTWENLVAACKICQQYKGDKFPYEVNMHPLAKPRAPTLLERFNSNIRIANALERKTWKLGFKKLGLDTLINSD